MVTNTAGDESEFNFPTLRDIGQTPVYFHLGKVWNLNQWVGIMRLSYLGIEPADDYVDKITAFFINTDRKSIQS